MVRLVAQLGGYVNRKREDEPGPQTVWLGLQRLHDIATCWKIFGPGAGRRRPPSERRPNLCRTTRATPPARPEPAFRDRL